MEYGMRVRVRYSFKHPENIYFTNMAMSGERTFRNITEVHYRPERENDIVAFESDIHGTGYTMPVEDVDEMEVRPDTELAADIQGD
jgi:hypothetical protein